MTMLVSQRQVALGTRGSIAEIGVHHGRYMIELALLREQGEAAVAIDLFELLQEQNVDRSGSGNKRIFTDNLKALQVPMDGLTIHSGDSLEMSSDDLLRLGGGVPYRLFSVDGGHRVVNVVHDLDIVSRALCEGAVVVLDDFNNPFWPGVNEGLFRYLSGENTLAPFCYGNNKLYLCREEEHDDWMQWVTALDFTFGVVRKEVELSGHKVFYADTPSPEQVWDMYGDGVGYYFKSGWHAREDGHIWSDGHGVIELLRNPTSKVRQMELSVCNGHLPNDVEIIAGLGDSEGFALQQGQNARLAIPLDIRESNMRIEIKSKTFVPRDVGMNNDPRALGIDVQLDDVRFR